MKAEAYGRQCRQRGFTLIELLVALVVMAVLAALSWQGIDSMMRARETTQASLERTLRLSNVMLQWEQDLVSVVQTPQSVAPALTFDGASVRMLRRTEAGMQVVVWALREGALLRWASPATTRSAQLLEFWLQSLQLLGNEAGQLRAIEGLASVQVYFYRNNAWTNPQSTGDFSAPAPEVVIPPAAGASGPSSGAVAGNPNVRVIPVAPSRARLAELPAGVRLQLGFASEGEEIRLTRDVVMSPRAP